MTDQEAILRSILASPEDDAPRLIYSDWLDEHDESERANLIRKMVALPSYTFTWRRGAKHGRHVHQVDKRTVWGLKGRVEAVFRNEWDELPGVERITIRRGFIETINAQPTVYLIHAGQLFARHPILDVRLAGLCAFYSFFYQGMYEAILSPDKCVQNEWPAVWFPEKNPGLHLYYADFETARADLSRRATAFGRRMAGVPKEPPPLPNRTIPVASR